MSRLQRKGHLSYDEEQVLEQLQKENQQLRHNYTIAKRQLESTIKQLELSQKRYQQLVDEIRAKDRAHEEISRLAVKEANEIVKTAHQNADIIIREALSTARQVLVEIARISNESNELRDDLNIRLKMLEQVIQGLEFPEVPNMKILNKEHDTFTKK